MKYYVLILLLAISLGLNSQSFTTGFLPDLTLSYKANEVFKIVHKVESRYPSFDTDSETLKVNFERLDFQNFVERKVGLFSKISVGYQFRINYKDNNEHRLIQQIAWSDFLRGYRLGHRFRTDQTFSLGSLPEFRFRYRLKVQLPLQGQELDKGEYYISLSDEVLWSYQSPNRDFENRVVAKIGLYINDKNKIETGLDWRADGFFINNVEHQLWFALSWYKTL